MTRLLEPSPGEAIDRITILGLKIEAGEIKKLDVANFKEEREALQQYMVDNYSNPYSLDRLEYYSTELQAVNGKLWQCEDQVRLLPSPDEDTAGEHWKELAILCKQIADLNDCRAALVGKINNLFGQSIQEKIYVQRNNA